MEYTCIYLKSNPNLTFNKKEHVFPSGLGCTTTLSKGDVSDQANELFSEMELELLRSSPIAMVRAFEGPGKRGSLLPDQQPKDRVSIATDENGMIELAYISLGSPYSITQIHKTGKGYSITLSAKMNIVSKECMLQNLFDDLSSFDNPFVTLESSRFSDQEYIIGFHNSKRFYAANRGKSLKGIKDEIAIILEKKELISKSILKSTENHVAIDLSYCMTEKSYKAIAKIAFNTASLCFGKAFVLNQCFDNIRNYIIKGKKTSDYVCFVPSDNVKNEIAEFPHKSHWCLLSKIENNIIATVCFYGLFTFHVLLSDCCKSIIPVNGFICDWLNKRDYTFIDMVNKREYERDVRDV